MSESGPFRPGLYGVLILARALPALIALGLCEAQSSLRPWVLVAAGLCLPVCIWCDLLIAWVARQRQWKKQVSQVQLEGFVDFISFIWAPAVFVIAVFPEPWLWISAGVFVLAGCYRLARFNTEGLVAGRYRGLPVTYNGYLFPASVLACHYLGWDALWFFSPIFIVVAGLMATRSIPIPEY